MLDETQKLKRPRSAAILKAIHTMELREASKAKALKVADQLEAARLEEAAGSSAGATPKSWPTPGSRASTDGAHTPTTPSSG